MTRNQIRGHLPKGVEGFDAKEAEDALYTLFNDALQTEREKLNAKITAAEERADEAEKTMQAALEDETGEKELGELKTKLEAAETRATTAEKALTDRNAEIETQTQNAALLEKIHAAAIKEGKLDGLGVKALKKHALDMSIVKHKNGEITNLEDVLKHYKEDDVIGDLWGGETITKGAGNGNPPPNQDNDKFTQYKTRLDEARKNNNTLEAVKIKTEAATEGVILI